MTQIYVVTTVAYLPEGPTRIPVAAFSDYPTALAYTERHFGLLGNPGGDSASLVYTLDLVPTPSQGDPEGSLVEAVPFFRLRSR